MKEADLPSEKLLLLLLLSHTDCLCALGREGVSWSCGLKECEAKFILCATVYTAAIPPPLLSSIDRL